MSLPILFKDDSLVVCLKPVGISSESPGLPDLIREQEGFPVFPVHRLDQTTGGVCVLARSSSVCTEMQRLFQQDQVIKDVQDAAKNIDGADSADSTATVDSSQYIDDWG